jgi:hypothetical protein
MHTERDQTMNGSPRCRLAQTIFVDLEGHNKNQVSKFSETIKLS